MTRNRILTAALLLLTCITAQSQERERYSGPYKNGKAQYSYCETAEHERCYDGPFRYERIDSNGRKDVRLIATFNHGRPTGLWTYTIKKGTDHALYRIHFNHYGAYYGECFFDQTTLTGGKVRNIHIRTNLSDNHPAGPMTYKENHALIQGSFTNQGLPCGSWTLRCNDRSDSMLVVQTFRNGCLTDYQVRRLADGRIIDRNSLTDSLNAISATRFFAVYDSAANSACVDGQYYRLDTLRSPIPTTLPSMFQAALHPVMQEIAGVYDRLFNPAMVRTRPEYIQPQLMHIVACDAPAALSDTVYATAEVMPQFPGGTTALWTFLGQHLKYPAKAAENGVQGRVMVRFAVGADGCIRQCRVTRGVSPELDAEALRVCRLLPRFNPGLKNGRPVSVWMTLPVTFRLKP